MGFEWYTLDDSLRRDQVIEDFESFLWTERYSAFGDFQIVTKSTYSNRQLLTKGTRLAMNMSKYVMTIDTISDVTAQDGTRNLTVTGKSLENLLNDRVAMPAITDLTSTPQWVITGTPGTIARFMFVAICETGFLSPQDTIPFYSPGTLLPPGSIPESSDLITVGLSPDTLYNSLKKICDAYALGFRIVRNADRGQVYFEVYTGNDLTSTQKVRSPVIFDPNLNNLEQISLLTSTAQIKTVAYVFAQNGSAVVYAIGADPSATGSDRRVLLVNSNNSDPASDALTAALQQEGLLALASYNTIYQFDGVLPPNIPYVYGRDYNLGDLVEERNSDGFANQMVVTEQIFSSDKTGDRSYPTLTLYQTETPGTWSSWDASQVWNDVDPSEVWGNV